jgi:hypothetical protein
MRSLNVQRGGPFKHPWKPAPCHASLPRFPYRSMLPCMDLDLILRRLKESEERIIHSVRHIEQERAMIAALERAGNDAKNSMSLLKEFEDSMTVHIAMRDRMLEELIAYVQALLRENAKLKGGAPNRDASPE